MYLGHSPWPCPSPAMLADNKDGSVKSVDEVQAVEQWVTTTALKERDVGRSDLAQLLEGYWNDATEAQLAVLKPTGPQYVPDLNFPPIYDKNFRRTESALRLAGFADTDPFTMPQGNERATDRPTGAGQRTSRRKKSSRTLQSW